MKIEQVILFCIILYKIKILNYEYIKVRFSPINLDFLELKNGMSHQLNNLQIFVKIIELQMFIKL